MTTLTPEDRARLRDLAAKAVPGFPGYEIRSDGTVWSILSNWRGYGKRQIKPVDGKGGYPKVRLHDSTGKRRSRYVHSLVAEAFLPPRGAGQQVRHLNGDKTDARLSNLAWGTAKQNAADRDLHETTARGVCNGFSKLNEDQVREVRRLRDSGMTYKEIEHATGVNREHARQIARKELWAHVI